MFFPEHATEKATIETITGFHRWTAALYSFKITRPQAYRFTAGQYSRLGLVDASGNLIWRAYSVVSSIHDEFLEYYVVDVPGGAFTSILSQLKTGAPILLEKQSYGFMTAERFTDGETLWMLATGTGIGPFISILQAPDVWTRFKHLVLVHSVRHADELAYREQLAALSHRPDLADLPAELRLVYTTTRDANPGTLHGRITTLLENGELEQAAGLSLTVEASRVMLCGNPQMIDETRKILHERGMRPVRRALPGQFLTENYW